VGLAGHHWRVGPRTYEPHRMGDQQGLAQLLGGWGWRGEGGSRGARRRWRGPGGVGGGGSFANGLPYNL
jgi:hypothetical protein